MKKKIIGIILIVLTLGCLGVWELWGRVHLTYDRVLVLSRTVAPNTIISEEMLREKRVDKASEGALLVGDANRVVGMETVHTIPHGAELYTEYFEEPKFVVGGDTGKYILSIPSEWLKSYPQTLKRGDTAIFYYGGEMVTEAVVAFVRDGSNQEVYYDEDRLESTANVSLVEIVVDKEQILKLGELADQGAKFVILYY